MRHTCVDLQIFLKNGGEHAKLNIRTEVISFVSLFC